MQNEPSPSLKTPENSNPIKDQGLKQTNNYLTHGIVGSTLLTIAYFIIVSLAESFDHAITQFVSLAYLFIPLIASFGIQVALFSYARQQSKLAHQRSTNVTTNGGVSTASMILCCVHHLTDVAALVGLTAVSLFLTTYQSIFILIGIVANIFAILTLLLFIQKTNLYNTSGFLAKPMSLNLKRTRKLAIVIGVIVVILAFAFVGFNQPIQQTSDSLSGGNIGRILTLPTKSVTQNGLTIQATPEPFKYGDSVKISLALDTHSGDLNFDLTQLATLQDGNGITYKPTGWGGSASGGHHVSGSLNFQPLDGQPSSMQLILKDVYGTDWAFQWVLNQ